MYEYFTIIRNNCMQGGGGGGGRLLHQERQSHLREGVREMRALNVRNYRLRQMLKPFCLKVTKPSGQGVTCVLCRTSPLQAEAGF